MLYSDVNSKIVDEKKDFLYLSQIYAHGFLEKLLTHDILFTDSIELYNDIYNYHHENDKFIRPHKIEDNKGNRHDVVMYLWRVAEKDKWIGLVCLKGDTEANQFAKTKYYSCSGNI